MDNKLTVLSQHDNIHGQKIGRQDLPTGFYANSLPAHRFVDYSKSQLNHRMQQGKATQNQPNTNLHGYAGDPPASQKNLEKRLDLLMPNFGLAEKNQRMG